MTPDQIEECLRNFTGSEEWVQYSPTLFPTVVLTDGARFVAQECGAFWLMDTISSHLPKVNDHFAVITLSRTGTQAVLTIADDDPASVIYAKQEFEYTDFPLDGIKMYAAYDGTYWCLMLRTEY